MHIDKLIVTTDYMSFDLSADHFIFLTFMIRIFQKLQKLLCYNENIYYKFTSISLYD